jgi:voltage-gated sodium channel
MGGFRASVRPLATKCRRIADDSRFQTFIFGVIFCNAITLGLGTYESIDNDVGSLLTVLDDVFLGIYVVELTIRILAFGTRPQDFFKDGWNVFDFVIITAAFLPGIRENVTLLRLARLLRVTRLVSVFPDLRVLVRAMARSLPPIGSLLVLTILLMFVYGMVGWILFHTEDPESWGTIGDAMLTLFIMLTLENWPTLLEAGQAIHPASWIFFVSYILLASFLVINILLAIIINSMEEVREVERQRERERRHRDVAEGGPAAEAALAADSVEAITRRLQTLRDALDDLESDLASGGQSDPRRQQQTTTKARLRP